MSADDPGGRRARRRTLLGALLALGASGCGDGGEDAAGPTGSPAPVEPSPSESGPPGAPDLDGGQELVRGLDVPWGLAFLPDGSALVSERGTGQILRVGVDGSAPERVQRIEGVRSEGEGGLLGLAVSPTYGEDELVYAYLTSEEGDNRVVRFRIGREPEPVFTGIAAAGNHNGGRIAFGPDSFLYVATGDAGDTSLARDERSPNGKILRLTPEGAAAEGNPTEGSPVWTMGHRNVQGMAWDSQGRMFASEFGQNRYDELNLIEPGGDYGWPEAEGASNEGRLTDPLLTWTTDEASPSGIAIAGDRLYMAALRGGRLWIVPLRGDGTVGEPESRFEGEYGRLRTVASAPDGALWLTTSNTDGRGEVRDGDDRIIRFPAE